MSLIAGLGPQPTEIRQMASIYKKPIVRVDPKTGEKKTTKSKKWWGRYRASNGKERRVPLAADKTAAQAMLNDLVRKAEREAAGLIDPTDDHAKRPLKQHIADYRRHLTAKGNTTSHIKLTISYIEKVVAGCKFRSIRDLSPSRVTSWLADLRSEGRGLRTSNAYLAAIKGFSRWLVRDGRLTEDRLAHVAALNTKVDLRHERRTLKPAEISKLIAAAKTGKKFRSLTGPDRAMLYHLAVTTGLRASELASLTPRSFDLGGDPPTVAVEAGYSKHRRRDVLLRADVADAMNEYLSSRQLRDDERLWMGSWSRKGSAIMIRKDLAAANIAYEDDAGRVFDFHALRHQFISSLAQAGVHPKEAQSLARHSTISLTMDRYTHLNLVDLTGALDRLPAIAVEESESEPQALAATGTDDAQPSNVDDERAKKKVPTMVPRGTENGAERLAPRTLKMTPKLHRTHVEGERPRLAQQREKRRETRGSWRHAASRFIEQHEAEGTGLEPATPYGAPEFQSGR